MSYYSHKRSSRVCERWYPYLRQAVSCTGLCNCSAKSGFECGSGIADFMGTVCEFKAEFLRLKWQFCPLDAQKCNTHLSSRTSLNELVWLRNHRLFLALYLNACKIHSISWSYLNIDNRFSFLILPQLADNKFLMMKNRKELLNFLRPKVLQNSDQH